MCMFLRLCQLWSTHFRSFAQSYCWWSGCCWWRSPCSCHRRCLHSTPSPCWCSPLNKSGCCCWYPQRSHLSLATFENIRVSKSKWEEQTRCQSRCGSLASVELQSRQDRLRALTRRQRSFTNLRQKKWNLTKECWQERDEKGDLVWPEQQVLGKIPERGVHWKCFFFAIFLG